MILTDWHPTGLRGRLETKILRKCQNVGGSDTVSGTIYLSMLSVHYLLYMEINACEITVRHVNLVFYHF